MKYNNSRFLLCFHSYLRFRHVEGCPLSSRYCKVLSTFCKRPCTFHFCKFGIILKIRNHVRKIQAEMNAALQHVFCFRVCKIFHIYNLMWSLKWTFVLGIHIDKSVLERMIMMHYKNPFDAFLMGVRLMWLGLFQRQENEIRILELM